MREPKAKAEIFLVALLAVPAWSFQSFDKNLYPPCRLSWVGYLVYLKIQI